MGRANRLCGGSQDGGVFHVTHRCHNQTFLLRFGKDRDAYRTKLREHVRRFSVSVLDYCITCNHVHLLVDVPQRLVLGEFMREVAGEFARDYNRRKDRANAFWGDNYHATLVEEGPYLWRCLCYIELNMVRCGVVAHPQEWEWVGYREIMGQRRRYRLIDLERLCWRLRASSMDEIRTHLEVSLSERMARDVVKREGCWTESLAVGSREFVERIEPRIQSRKEMEILTIEDNLWALREEQTAYGRKTSPKNVSKALN